MSFSPFKLKTREKNTHSKNNISFLFIYICIYIFLLLKIPYVKLATNHKTQILNYRCVM